MGILKKEVYWRESLYRRPLSRETKRRGKGKSVSEKKKKCSFSFVYFLPQGE